MTDRQPDFFDRLVRQQAPRYLWIAAPTAACRPTRSWACSPASSSCIETSPTSSCTVTSTASRFTFSHASRCGSGCWRYPSGCATFCTATPTSTVPPCVGSCAWWSNACARTVQVQVPRRASARSPSATASVPPSMPTCTSTAWSSTASQRRARHAAVGTRRRVSVDALVRIEAADRAGRERLLRNSRPATVRSGTATRTRSRAPAL